MITDDSKYATFGVNWYRLGNRNVYVFHGSPIGRYHVPFNDYGRKRSFIDVFQGVGTDGSLDELTNDEILQHQTN